MLTGAMMIGRERVMGTAGAFNGINPASGEALTPSFGGATPQQLDRVCALAWRDFDAYRAVPLATRARFLETIAERFLAIGDALIDRATTETGLPRAQLEIERGRTARQLRLFAAVVRAGDFLEPRIDTAIADRQPLPRSDLRLWHVPVGPVAVFGSSNFPLAFSVAGGDTAAAFAAGCPVIVKAHNAHPGVSELVGSAVQAAVGDCGLPEGTFSMLFATDNEIGGALVADARIKSVGFTGSFAGGTALMKIAAQRREPIPVHAEMSSINPLVLLPMALERRAAVIATGFAASLRIGAGQFCTNPGLVLGLQSPGLDTFAAAAAAEVHVVAGLTMLTAGIQRAYERGVARVAGAAGVKTLARGKAASGCFCQAALFMTDAATFLAEPALHEEVFGASSLIVSCRDAEQLREVIERLEGQLTATLQLEAEDVAVARGLLPTLERKVGRILVNGFPTGVEVAHAMVHGGPFPATSDSRFTSVGTLSIRRFLRPVCYQDVPAALLPEALLDANPLGLQRLLDGELRRQ